MTAAMAVMLAACSFAAGTADMGDDAPGAMGGDGGGPVVGDPDGDGIDAETDNCPAVENGDQADGDGDLVGDACDNCPTAANAPVETLGAGLVQRDHDGDGRGDVCDPCPHLADGSHADADGDGIGEVCDLFPSAKNPPAYFNGFYEAPAAAEWEVPGNGGAMSDWVVVERGGKVGWRQMREDVDRRHQLLLKVPREQHHVSSLVMVDSITPGGASQIRTATVTTGFERFDSGGGVDVYFSCGLRHDRTNSNETVVASVQRDDTPQGDNQVAWAGGMVGVAVPIVVRATRTGSTTPRQGGSMVRCTAGASTAGIDPGSPYYPDGKVGLRTYGVTAWFDYIFVVDPRTVP